MKQKCDKCAKPATVHLTEIVDGQKIEKHLCEDCAVSEGITIKANIPISQLLEEFILQSGESDEGTGQLKCEVCGFTLSDFRRKGLLGCPNDYDAFGAALEGVISRAQEGAARHVGKVPARAGSDTRRQTELLRLRGELKDAVDAEDYERAAGLRDRIREMEQS